jgi:hypothetical protein
MSFSVTCKCGKSLNIKDEYVGKRIKCPTCGATFTATKPTSTAPSKKDRLAAGIHLSPAAMVFIALLILIPGTLAIWKYGPGRVRDQWEKLEPKAKSDVTDVVDRALQGSAGGEDTGAGGLAHGQPHALDITFPFSPMGFSMPTELGFAGTTTQGGMTGKYNTKTGEIEAEVEVGGLSFPGAGVQRHGAGKIKVTGRVKDGAVSAEVDGKPVHLDWGDPSKHQKM